MLNVFGCFLWSVTQEEDCVFSREGDRTHRRGVCVCVCGGGVCVWGVCVCVVSKPTGGECVCERERVEREWWSPSTCLGRTGVASGHCISVLLSWPAVVRMSVLVPQACWIPHIYLTERWHVVRVAVCGLNLPQAYSQWVSHSPSVFSGCHCPFISWNLGNERRVISLTIIKFGYVRTFQKF